MNIRLFSTVALFSIGTLSSLYAEKSFSLDNPYLGRVLTVNDQEHLQTTQLINHLAHTESKLLSAPEFQLVLTKKLTKNSTDVILTSKDFKVVKTEKIKKGNTTSLVFSLKNDSCGISLQIVYSLSSSDFVMRKKMTITSLAKDSKNVTPWILKRVNIEALPLKDAYQPYTKDAITAQAPSQWSPNLGQPLYTKKSATFWGVEFPAARNKVSNGLLLAGYLHGTALKTGVPYSTYSAVFGVADQPDYVSRAFLKYIDNIRIRPLRLQTQYNSWFDFSNRVDAKKFAKSVKKVHSELVEKRGVKPLRRYVIDDGWQDTKTPWTPQKVWPINNKFSPDFSATRKATKDAQSGLGLWISPGCLFGAQGAVPSMKKAGMEALDNWMSMAGPQYMQALENRMVTLTKQGVGFYKLDGIFGHLNTREFELHGARYGIPEVTNLVPEDFKANDRRLNDPQYNEAKLYYLTAGTERMMKLFRHVSQVDPNVYIVISNGAYLSPWWLQYVDTVWMINAGDAAVGSGRTGELVYRDSRYYTLFHNEHTQFPLDSLFNHEPKKVKTGESKETFRHYLFMSLSRGTGFAELYLKPHLLSSDDWDVLAEGLKWAERFLPTFKTAHMHGGNPAKKEVYGYTGWAKNLGYISIHNPSDKAQTYTITLNRAFGLPKGAAPYYHLSSPFKNGMVGLPSTVKLGDALTIKLQPKEIRFIECEARIPGR